MSPTKGRRFLTKLANFPARLQAKLLRVIQEQTFIPVGKTTASDRGHALHLRNEP